MAITLDGTDGITTTGLISNGNAVITTQSPQLGRRNLIINGAMQVAQRGTSITGVTGSGYYSLDRFQLGDNTTGTFDISQASDGPDYSLEYCYHLDVQTADTSITAADICHVRYYVEGKDLSHVGLGESGTRYITLSFWHKHTKTGTYCVSFVNSGNNRSYISEYTQNTSDTWEKTEVTVPVDTSGTWLTTNEVGLRINFVVASGSDWHGTADTWLSSLDFATSNQVNGLDSTSNNFKITGVQLEVGDTATPFEHRSYGEELALCKRYFETMLASSNSSRTAIMGSAYSSSTASNYFEVEKRASGTLSLYDYDATLASSPTNRIEYNSIGTSSGYFISASNIITQKTFFHVSVTNTGLNGIASFKWTLDAEL